MDYIIFIVKKVNTISSKLLNYYYSKINDDQIIDWTEWIVDLITCKVIKEQKH